MPNICVGLMGVLAKAGADRPEIGDSKASSARAAGVAAGKGLVGEIGIKV